MLSSLSFIKLCMFLFMLNLVVAFHHSGMITSSSSHYSSGSTIIGINSIISSNSVNKNKNTRSTTLLHMATFVSDEATLGRHRNRQHQRSSSSISRIFRVPPSLQWTTPPVQIINKKQRDKRAPSSISSSISNTFVLYSDQEKDRDVLSYLPQKVPLEDDHLPQTKELLKAITKQYVIGDTSSSSSNNNDDSANASVNLITSNKIIRVIEQEYQIIQKHPVIRIGQNEIGSTQKQKQKQKQNQPHNTTRAQRNLILILSFAALHRLPIEIIYDIFKQEINHNNNNISILKPYLESIRQANDNDGSNSGASKGWNNISFPRGLAIQLPRNRLTSRRERMIPIPRRWLQKRNRRMAVEIVNEAAQTKPPIRRLTTEHELLVSLEKELTKSRGSGGGLIRRWRGRGGRISLQRPSFFRTQNNSNIRRFQTFDTTITTRLVQAIQAWIISCSFLQVAWITLTFFQSWCALPITTLSSGSTTATTTDFVSTIHRFQQAAWSQSVNLGGPSHIFKWVALPMGTLLAPLAFRVLSFTKRRWNISENRAFIKLLTTIMSSALCFFVAIFYMDAVLLRKILYK